MCAGRVLAARQQGSARERETHLRASLYAQNCNSLFDNSVQRRAVSGSLSRDGNERGSWVRARSPFVAAALRCDDGRKRYEAPSRTESKDTPLSGIRVDGNSDDISTYRILLSYLVPR